MPKLITMAKYHQGKFTPKNPSKFSGDITNITFRSSWELKCMQFFDANPAITKVLSEEIAIEYFNPVKRRPAKYYPDFYIEYTKKDGTIHKVLVEVKPSTQVVEQAKETTHAKLTRAINYAKWTAAVEWCKQRGITFQILTESEIFGK